MTATATVKDNDSETATMTQCCTINKAWKGDGLCGKGKVTAELAPLPSAPAPALPPALGLVPVHLQQGHGHGLPPAPFDPPLA